MNTPTSLPRKIVFVGARGSGKSKAVYDMLIGPRTGWRYMRTRGTDVHPLGEGRAVWDCSGDEAELPPNRFAATNLCVTFGRNGDAWGERVRAVSPNVTIVPFTSVAALTWMLGVDTRPLVFENV